MKVLFSLDNYDRGSGGAEKDAQGFARGLAERGNRVEVLQFGTEDVEYMDGPVHVSRRRLRRRRWLRRRNSKFIHWNEAWQPLLKARLEQSRPDLLVTQQALIPSSIDAARAAEIPVVAMVQSYGLFCPREFAERDPLSDCTLMCAECLSASSSHVESSIEHLERARLALTNATLVVANSRYVQRVVAKQLGLSAAIVHPPVDLDAYRPREGPHDRVLFVKPQYVKGLQIATEIARRMPQTGFLVAGAKAARARRTLGRLRNVEMLGWTADMPAAYARASVLIGPSIWPEPFGRVFVEAALSGVPSVASHTGGIPESIGNQELLVDEIFDIDEWVEKVGLARDPGRRSVLIREGRRRAELFSTSRACERLATEVRRVTGVVL